MPPEALGIAAGVGWGLAIGFMAGFWTGLRQTPERMRALEREVDDELEKLAHQRDRDRKRVNNREPAAAADLVPATGAEGVSGVDRKSAIRRRAYEQGLLRSTVIPRGGNLHDLGATQ